MSDPTSAVATVKPQSVTRPGARLGLPTQVELNALNAYATLVIKSGLSGAHKTPEAAVVVMRYGHQLGLDEFTALQNMYVISGKPAAQSSLLHSLILRDHGGDAIVVKKSDATECVLSCRRRDSKVAHEVSYTMEEAKTAGLQGGNWSKYPKDMLFARAVSRAGRQVFRDSTLGMYTPEELGSAVIEVNGEVVDEQPETITEVVEDATPLRSRTKEHVDQTTGEITDAEVTPVTAKITRDQVDRVVELVGKLGLSADDVKAMHGKGHISKLTGEEGDKLIDELLDRIIFRAREAAEQDQRDAAESLDPTDPAQDM